MNPYRTISSSHFPFWSIGMWRLWDVISDRGAKLTEHCGEFTRKGLRLACCLQYGYGRKQRCMPWWYIVGKGSVAPPIPHFGTSWKWGVGLTAALPRNQEPPAGWPPSRSGKFEEKETLKSRGMFSRVSRYIVICVWKNRSVIVFSVKQWNAWPWR